MGDLSEHFSHKDFICRCNSCRGKEFKIHLGLVGILEEITEHFKKPVKIVAGFWCDDYHESLKREKRSPHNTGKAVHINIEEVPPSEIFKFAEKIPEVNGLGLYPKEGFVHIDTRPKEKRALWIKEGNNYSALTEEKRRYYNL